jgi:monoamine oxidase
MTQIAFKGSRWFMKGTILLITFLISLFLTEVIAEPPRTKENPEIVVVGAGLSGLTAAYRLKEKGFDVHVYEAKKRVGGRIFTVQVQNRIAELGAQNILSGGAAKNVLSLVNEMGLELINRKIDFTMYYCQDNECIRASELLKSQQFNSEELKSRIREIAKNSKNMKEVLLQLFDSSDLAYKMLSVILTAYEGGRPESLSSIYDETLYHLLTGGLCAAHPGNDENRTELDILSIQGGNSLLPEKLAEKVKITTNMPLQAISKNLEGSYNLFFKNGEIKKADILILAIPCSVFRDIKFEQGIIEEDRLIEMMNVQYGSMTKFVVPINNEPKREGLFINEQALTFSATDPQILNLYLLDEEETIFSSEHIFARYQDHISLLKTGFEIQNFPTSLPVTANQTLIFYDGPVGYRWSADPFIKGTFSSIRAGQENILTRTNVVEGEIVKTLFSPIDQSLYFVGEHTTILNEVPGTMEAACESGERMARIISSILSK